MAQEPDVPCPSCERTQWVDSAGFGTIEPVWMCGYCAGDPPPKEAE